MLGSWIVLNATTRHDRDLNAAVNIRNYGLGQIDQRNTIVENTVGTIGV